MTRYSITILLFSLFVATLSLAVAVPVTQQAGGVESSDEWTPIKVPSDRRVVDVASFAVWEHNRKENAQLKFSKVTQGWTQGVPPNKYRLVIDVYDANGVVHRYRGPFHHFYEAIVWVDHMLRTKRLISFKQMAELHG